MAEGVETEEQWRWLLNNGAGFVQGCFFAKPAFPPSLSTTAYAWHGRAQLGPRSRV